MRVTQQDIAKHLGLSVATVSRALSNSSRLNPGTRSRVMDAAAKLGYMPARTCRPANSSALSGPTTTTLGVLLRYDGAHAHPGHTRMLAGVSDICEGRGIALMVHYAQGDHLQRLVDGTRPAMLQPGGAGGLILLNHLPADIVEWLAERWPCVEINHHVAGLDADIIDVDANAGIGALVERLLDLGHRDIGFVGDSRQYTWAHARHAAFFQALNTAGLDYDPSRFARTTSKQAHELADWLDERTRGGVTAWVCANDGLAKNIAAELLDLGYSIPEDVSLTGFDGTASLADGRRITSIATPYEALGAAAAHRLLRRLEYPQAARPHILIQGRLVEGETVAPPRNREERILSSNRETRDPKTQESRECSTQQ